MTVRYQSLNSIVMDLPLACLGSCPEAVILIFINDNKSIMFTDSKKSDLFPSLMTGNEEDDNTRSSLYSSQMKSRSNDASQNTLFLSNFWPVWQPDGDEERLPWRQHLKDIYMCIYERCNVNHTDY